MYKIICSVVVLSSYLSISLENSSNIDLQTLLSAYKESFDAYYIVDQVDSLEFYENLDEMQKKLSRMEELPADIKVDIARSETLESALMDFIVDGQISELAAIGCDIVDLHGSVGTHLRALRGLSVCASSPCSDYKKWLEILSANAKRSELPVDNCLTALKKMTESKPQESVNLALNLGHPQ